MANLNIKAQIVYNPASGTVQGLDSGLLSAFSNAGSYFNVFSQSVDTFEEPIVVGADVVSIGYVLIVNVTEHMVYVGYADNEADDDCRPIRIKQNEFALFRAKGTLYARCVSDAGRIKVYAFQE